MKRLILVLILAAMTATPTFATEAENFAADRAEWAEWDAENAGLKQLEAELVANPFVVDDPGCRSLGMDTLRVVNDSKGNLIAATCTSKEDN